MERYRERPKPPVSVDAEQWWPGCDMPGVEELPGHLMADGSQRAPYGLLRDPNNGEWLRVRRGWWVLTDAFGSKNVLSPETFAARYERDDEAEERIPQ